MRRNLRFWTRFTWELIEGELVILGMFLALNLFSGNLLWSNGSGWTDFFALAPCYLIAAAVICFMVTTISCQTVYVPLLVSHGEPRRNVFWGFQYHRFLLIAVTSAASGLTWALVPGRLAAACLLRLPLITTLLLICSSLCNLVSSAYVKWKRLGAVSLVLFFGACGGLAGWLMASEGLDSTVLALFAQGLSALPLAWQLAALAVFILAVDMGVQWLLLRRREVKF